MDQVREDYRDGPAPLPRQWPSWPLVSVAVVAIVFDFYLLICWLVC